MCGIAGTYGPSSWDVDRALDRIQHRGPDGRGVVEVGGAVHGHVRLAIRDPLPRSDQPFVYADVTLSYVGELWNADELRERLQASGSVFQTTSDTEVVAAALQAWGTDALRELDGMFALAWTDAGGTYLARDRFGKVPLYWTPPLRGLFADEIRWASERKAWEPAAAEGVVAFQPGYFADLSRGAYIEGYYALPEPMNGRENGSRHVRALLERGVRRRMVSDVPVCCLISGGMDSAAILRMAQAYVPDVVAYHAYSNPGSPDLEAARRLCSAWDVELREVYVQDTPWSLIYEAVQAVEVPMKAQVEIAMLCLPLARRLREDGFRVVLSGEAADELFGGYGNLARRSGSDQAWRNARVYATAKMARGNFMRVNKVFMAHGVEARLPFMERELVEYVLGLGVWDCPPGKTLLKRALEGLVPDWVLERRKETFQGAGGTIAACASMFDSPAKVYNQMAREIFGALPRD